MTTAPPIETVFRTARLEGARVHYRHLVNLPKRFGIGTCNSMSSKLRSATKGLQSRKRPPRYTPFERHQIRLALQSYKRKHGIKWEHYANELREVLGLKKGTPGINDKDPKNFVTFESEPTDSKLFLFYRFIEKACPEYLHHFSIDKRFARAAEGVSAFFSLDQLKESDIEKLEHLAGTLEKFLFCPQVDLIEDKEIRIWSMRRIAGTPYLLVQSFWLDSSQIPRQRNPANITPLFRNGTVGADRLNDLTNLVATDDLHISFHQVGFAVPIGRLGPFISAIFNTEQHSSQVNYFVLLKTSYEHPVVFDLTIHVSGILPDELVNLIERINYSEDLCALIQKAGGWPSSSPHCLCFKNESLKEFFLHLDRGVL